MPVADLGLALAIHCKLHKEEARTARGQLDITPRAHFDEGRVWADSNSKTVSLMRSDPEAIAAGSYELNEARGWFSRLVGLGKSRGVSAPDDEELQVLQELQEVARKRTVDPEKRRKLAEARALVDDALDTP
jgi:hypothetical protein